MIGKTFGHYQISDQIGKGGMGEVYQAKDAPDSDKPHYVVLQPTNVVAKGILL